MLYMRWPNFHYLEMNGRIRKRSKLSPRIENVKVREALRKLNIRYREHVAFINPLYQGWKNEIEAAAQWLDFCIYTGEEMKVLLFDLNYIPHHGAKPHEKRAFEAKQKYLAERNIDYLILARNCTTQVYEYLIKSFMKRRRI